MYTRVSELSDFLLRLQDRSRSLDASSLIARAVADLADVLGYDCAWYGWGQVNPGETVIHTNMSLNLPGSYFSSWQAIADQDLLVKQFLEDPGSVATYDRNGSAQTDGMQYLADAYGLKKMATAMCVRPGRSSSFYLSAYRGGGNALPWEAEEREFLQCAVNNISQAARNAATLELNPTAGPSASAYISRQGNVILGLSGLRERFGHLWSRHDQDDLPGRVMDYITAPGEHVLPDEDLVITCQPAHTPCGLDWQKLSIRPFDKMDSLTPREREVARALASGKTHKVVAKHLGISPSTVRNQTRSIYRKTGVKNRAQLTRSISEFVGPMFR